MEFVKCSVIEKPRNLYVRNGKLYLKANSRCETKKYLKLKNVLGVSYVSKDFPGTYHPYGIIFETTEKPVFWSPINSIAISDLIALICKSRCSPKKKNKMIKEIIGTFYFKTKEAMAKKFINSTAADIIFGGVFQKAWEECGFEIEAPYRAKPYTEVLFDKDIQITIKALFCSEEFLPRFVDKLKKQNTDVLPLLSAPRYDKAVDYFKKQKRQP